MLTVSQLSKRYSLSRTTILYYEKVGLLEPASRSESGYRYYAPKQLRQLEQILAYRSFGLSIKEIGKLLVEDDSDQQQRSLIQQFTTLESEIVALRNQQQSILALLEQSKLKGNNKMSKARWVNIMQQAGFSEDGMTQWHQQFEARAPQAHQAFLESLNLTTTEIAKIRAL